MSKCPFSKTTPAATTVSSSSDSSFGQLKAFLNITAQDINRLPQVYQYLKPHFDTLLQAFYQNILKNEHLQQVIAPTYQEALNKVPELIEAQKNYWKLLLTEGLNDTYHHSALQVGQAHVRVKLDTNWFIGAYSQLLDTMLLLLDKKLWYRPGYKTQLQQALIKAIMLDISLTTHAYNETLRQAALTQHDQNIQRFNQNVRGQVNAVADVTQQVENTISDVVEVTQETCQKTTSAIEMVQSSQQNTLMVSNAVEELAQSIQEISERIGNASESTQQAEGQMKSVSVTIHNLSQATQEIGKVTELIQNIAKQTNLLALNATIESASAGEAGKGFAVVANEVKSLASATTEATKTINEKILAIQAEVQQAVQSIDEANVMISDITQATTSIAAAVEEQSVTTTDISRNICHVANEAQHLADNIATVNQASQQAQQQTLASARLIQTLKSESSCLQQKVEQFVSSAGEQ